MTRNIKWGLLISTILSSSFITNNTNAESIIEEQIQDQIQEKMFRTQPILIQEAEIPVELQKPNLDPNKYKVDYLDVLYNYNNYIKKNNIEEISLIASKEYCYEVLYLNNRKDFDQIPINLLNQMLEIASDECAENHSWYMLSYFHNIEEKPYANNILKKSIDNSVEHYPCNAFTAHKHFKDKVYEDDVLEESGTKCARLYPKIVLENKDILNNKLFELKIIQIAELNSNN
ncbi:hypothetical protein ACFL1H_00885 [Nanoarchaeota archaeon]